MPNINIRDVPNNLYLEVKKAVLESDVSLREWILDAIANRLTGGKYLATKNDLPASIKGSQGGEQQTESQGNPSGRLRGNLCSETGRERRIDPRRSSELHQGSSRTAKNGTGDGPAAPSSQAAKGRKRVAKKWLKTPGLTRISGRNSNKRRSRRRHRSVATASTAKCAAFAIGE